MELSASTAPSIPHLPWTSQTATKNRQNPSHAGLIVFIPTHPPVSCSRESGQKMRHQYSQARRVARRNGSRQRPSHGHGGSALDLGIYYARRSFGHMNQASPSLKHSQSLPSPDSIFDRDAGSLLLPPPPFIPPSHHIPPIPTPYRPLSKPRPLPCQNLLRDQIPPPVVRLVSHDKAPRVAYPASASSDNVSGLGRWRAVRALGGGNAYGKPGVCGGWMVDLRGGGPISEGRGGNSLFIPSFGRVHVSRVPP